MPKHVPDSIDWKILARLQENARLTNVELARAVNLSPSPCLKRVRILEDSGIIGRYVALLDPRSAWRARTCCGRRRCLLHARPAHAAAARNAGFQAARDRSQSARLRLPDARRRPRSSSTWPAAWPRAGISCSRRADHRCEARPERRPAADRRPQKHGHRDDDRIAHRRVHCNGRIGEPPPEGDAGGRRRGTRRCVLLVRGSGGIRQPRGVRDLHEAVDRNLSRRRRRGGGAAARPARRWSALHSKRGSISPPLSRRSCKRWANG